MNASNACNANEIPSTKSHQVAPTLPNHRRSGSCRYCSPRTPLRAPPPRFQTLFISSPVHFPAFLAFSPCFAPPFTRPHSSPLVSFRPLGADLMRGPVLLPCFPPVCPALDSLSDAGPRFCACFSAAGLVWAWPERWVRPCHPGTALLGQAKPSHRLTGRVKSSTRIHWECNPSYPSHRRRGCSC